MPPLSEPFPDIEVYVMRPDPGDLLAWLEERFAVDRTAANGNTRTLRLDGDIECVIVENAVKGGYTSIWFKSGRTPWASDIDCAREVFERLGLEVRCSAGSWHEGDDDEGRWIRISDAGESVIDWL